MALAIFLGAFILLCVVGAYFVVASDRKRAIRHGRVARFGGGGLGNSVPVVVLVSSDSAMQIAKEAIRQVGGREVVSLSGSAAVGWIGSSWTNLPNRSEYELRVSLSTLADGSTQFVCSGRPRFASQLTGTARSRELATRLASEVSSLAKHYPLH